MLSKRYKKSMLFPRNPQVPPESAGSPESTGSPGIRRFPRKDSMPFDFLSGLLLQCHFLFKFRDRHMRAFRRLRQGQNAILHQCG